MRSLFQELSNGDHQREDILLLMILNSTTHGMENLRTSNNKHFTGFISVKSYSNPRVLSCFSDVETEGYSHYESCPRTLRLCTESQGSSAGRLILEPTLTFTVNLVGLCLETPPPLPQTHLHPT